MQSEDVAIESFVTKVRFANGPQFNPMLEEKGRWEFGEVRQYDVEMVHAMIEDLAEASQQIVGRHFNLFKRKYGKIILLNLEINLSDFLVKEDVIKFEVNT